MMDWNKRFVQQALWTKGLRDYLFNRTGMGTARRVLEVGCGTGAILKDLNTTAAVHGLDLQIAGLVKARLNVPRAFLTGGDALSLPFTSGVFDIVFCHFLLLWVPDPLQALREMKRVSAPGGSLLALAEPDYSNRVDRPEELVVLGRCQSEALQRQGAHPDLGARLADLFVQADIPLIETGRMGASGEFQLTPEERSIEWEVLESDLSGQIPFEQIQHLKQLDQISWERHTRVLYVPTYFAWGQLSQMV